MSNKTGILILLKYLLNSCVCRHPIIRYLPVVKIENWYKYVVGRYVCTVYTVCTQQLFSEIPTISNKTGMLILLKYSTAVLAGPP